MRKLFHLIPSILSLLAINCCFALDKTSLLPCFVELTQGKTAPNLLLNLRPLLAAQDIRIDLKRTEIFLNADQTYETLITYEKTLLSTKGLLENQSLSSPSYFPPSSEVELVEAYTLQEDGARIHVPATNVFTTTTPSDPGAPGFITSLQKHVVFPHLKIGSKLHVKWKYKRIAAPLFNFADVFSPDFATETLLTQTSINVPQSQYIKWAQTGEFTVKEAVEGDRRIITATLGPQPAHQSEDFMTAHSDSQPFFEVSTIRSWEEIGNTLSKLIAPTQNITPDIRELALSIVGNKKGKEAVQAIYNWTAAHIAYLATAINPDQGLISPPVSEILANRFGDCKGHSSVLQTLLRVIEIEAFPVLVNWDNSLKQFPLPILNFDHEMVFVPFLNLFLNPTDAYSTFGSPLEETNFISEGTQVLADKPVLIVKPTGSLLTKTPAALPEKNQYHLTSQLKMNLEGDMQAKGKLNTSGCFADLLRGILAEEGPINDFINELMLNNGIRAKATASATDPADLSTPLKIDYAWEGMQIAQRYGEELLFQVPLAIDFFNSHFFRGFLSPSSNRNYPLIMGAAIYQWDYKIDLPTDYTFSKQPSDIWINNEAGSYKATYTPSTGSLKIQRTLTLNKNIYSPEQYPAVEGLLLQLLQDRNAIFTLAPQI